MFFQNKKERIKMLQQIQFTSKASLKQQCLYITGGDIKETKELYDFLVADMPDLPATDPIPPTWQESTKSTVNGIFSWFQQNQGTIAQGIEYIRGLLGKAPLQPPEPPAAPLPPING